MLNCTATGSQLGLGLDFDRAALTHAYALIHTIPSVVSGLKFRVIVWLEGEALPQSEVFCSRDLLVFSSIPFHPLQPDSRSHSMMLPQACVIVRMVRSGSCAVLVFSTHSCYFRPLENSWIYTEFKLHRGGFLLLIR
ncbi:hypothetical protein XENOCAPTIV_025672 [Xenoophorus captivus]|uniref:Uncharacterized protein n=1 Tax=Xenoophorus captivus TaxID=1517983 RepID=A0ABV0RJK0_9TELE